MLNKKKSHFLYELSFYFYNSLTHHITKISFFHFIFFFLNYGGGITFILFLGQYILLETKMKKHVLLNKNNNKTNRK
jgi:hypothetical protein